MGRAIIALDERLLIHLLDLPAGTRVLGCMNDPMRLAVAVGVESDVLPETEQGVELPRVWPTVETDAEGRHSLHWPSLDVESYRAVEVGHGETPPEGYEATLAHLATFTGKPPIRRFRIKETGDYLLCKRCTEYIGVEDSGAYFFDGDDGPYCAHCCANDSRRKGREIVEGNGRA